MLYIRICIHISLPTAGKLYIAVVTVLSFFRASAETTMYQNCTRTVFHCFLRTSITSPTYLPTRDTYVTFTGGPRIRSFHSKEEETQ